VEVPSDSNIAVVTGSSRRDYSGTLQLHQGGAIVFDATRSGEHLEDIVVKGTQLSLRRLFPSDVPGNFAQRPKSA
jgi:hypothetical protein